MGFRYDSGPVWEVEMRLWLAVLLGVGCSVQPVPEAGPLARELTEERPRDESLPPPTVISLAVEPIVQIGTPFTLSATDALEGERVFYVVGGDPGVGPCPLPLGGYCVGLTRPVIFAGANTADGEGGSSLDLVAPPWPDSVQCFQALIIRGPGGINSALSNVECVHFCGRDDDGDGVCDELDNCDGNDAAGDTDGDLVCDDIDPCPLDAADDSDGDTVCDSDDLCPGDDLLDSDSDGVCDALDACDGFDDSLDGDGDGIPDDCDYRVSCLDILDAGLSTGDGYYMIDPDGRDGPLGEIEVLCDMSTEGGGYTYLGIDGVSTSRSTDYNSCMDYGMDIVYPRSRDHWASLLARFDTSFFSTIPGVTKPSGGGSYTWCAMNSGSCPDWRVPDGGRWWLRDSTYTEPNGDYEANCWLSMYGHDLDDIRFNDGTCSYSTSRYVCSTNDKL